MLLAITICVAIGSFTLGILDGLSKTKHNTAKKSKVKVGAIAVILSIVFFPLTVIVALSKRYR